MTVKEPKPRKLTRGVGDEDGVALAVGIPSVTVADPPFTRSTIVTAQLVLSTDPPHMIARIAWNASVPRRAAVPAIERTLANRSAPH